MRHWITQVLFCLMLIAPAFAQGECVAAEGQPLTLGAVFPTEFLLIPQDSEAFYGADTMREAINACGGVNGQPVEWVLVPAYNRDDAVAAVEQLAQQVPLIVGSGSSAVYEGLVEATQLRQLPLWEVTQISVEPTDNLFSPQPNDERVGRETAMFVQSDIIPTLAGETPRIALIYENAPRAEGIAEGFRNGLGDSILLDIPYEDTSSNLRGLAVELRESKINIVFTISFHWNAEQLWNAMRRADANVAAWITTGNAEDISQSCERFGNTDSMTIVGTAGLVRDAFPALLDNAIYERYISLYMEKYGQLPSESANQSASGVYVLLQSVLPTANDTTSTPSIVEAFMSVESVDVGSVVTIRQNQEGNVCLLSPDELATCSEPYQSFPTWRTRAIVQEQRGC